MAAPPRIMLPDIFPERLRFLHGGIKGWQAAGYSLETEPRRYAPVVYEMDEPQDHLTCTLPQAVSKLGDDDVVFWDTRTVEEYTGERGGNNPPDRVGHIPRAVRLEWNDLTDRETGFFKPAEEMRRILEEKGITPEKEIVTY